MDVREVEDVRQAITAALGDGSQAVCGQAA